MTGSITGIAVPAVGKAYVYLLRDPAVHDPVASIFYVGKGTGLRAQEHTTEAERHLTALAERTDDAGSRAEINRKVAKIQEITGRGQDVVVDVLAAGGGAGLPDQVAFDVEAALIAVLRMTELGNVVRGHGVRLMPESVFARASAAEPRGLPPTAAALAVPVKGLWGGQDYAGTLLAAGEDQAWDNARQLWAPIAAARASRIADLAVGDAPAVLLALAKHPDRRRRNVVVGVFELLAAQATDRLKGGGLKADGSVGRPYAGWEFVRRPQHQESSATTDLRAALLGHTLVDSAGEPVHRTQGVRFLQGI